MSFVSGVLGRIDRARRRVLWHRRSIAAVLAATAAYVAVQAATAPPPATVGVWTAARDLPAGTVLAAGDLVRRRFTPRSVPADTVRPGAVLGRTLAVPLARGDVPHPSSVVGDGWLAGHQGRVAVPVRVTDPAVVPLLHPGDHVDLVAADPQHPGDAVPVSSDATVLVVPPAAHDDGSLPGRMVLLGVPASDANAVAAASAASYVTVTWR